MACDGPTGPALPPSPARRQGALDAPLNAPEQTFGTGPESGANEQEVSNSLFTARSCRADSAGADTVRFLFRVSDLAGHTFCTGPRRSVPVVDEGSGELQDSGLICGATELATRTGGREAAVWVEGRPDQLFHGKGHDALLPVDRLPEADEILRESLERIGVELDGSATEVGRIDTTASLELASRSEMQVAMQALHDAPPPRRKVDTVKNRGVWETLTFIGRTGQRYERVYGEGPTHGAARERFLRFEAQNRYQSRTRLPLSEWSADRAQDQFAKRFAIHRERVGVVTIGNLFALSDELTRLHRAGEVSTSAWTNLLGYLMHRECGNHLGPLAPRTVRKYESELARLGLTFDPDVTDPIRVDVQAMLDRAMTLDWASA